MFSNCLIEALKAKVKDPKNTKIHIIKHLSNDSIFWHFWWEDNEYAYNFISEKPRRFQVFLFKGNVDKKPLENYIVFSKLCDQNYKNYKLEKKKGEKQ